MSIHYIQRKNINLQSWNTRVMQSGKGLPYALSSYLDIVCNGQWDAIITDDYSSIFPLPFEYKLGQKLYLQPFLTQQLGLISNNYSSELLTSFLDTIPNDFIQLSLKLNEYNSASKSDKYSINTKSNYTLSLEKPYDELSMGYSKSLRKRIKKSKIIYRIAKIHDAQIVIEYYKQELNQRLNFSVKKYQIATQLIQYLLDNNQGIAISALNEDNVEGILFLIINQHRIINLFGASNKDGRSHFAMHFLIDYMIQGHSNSDIVFDFEGSDLSGVREFYQSFGSKRKIYQELVIDQIPIWYRAVKWMKNTVS